MTIYFNSKLAQNPNRIAFVYGIADGGNYNKEEGWYALFFGVKGKQEVSVQTLFNKFLIFAAVKVKECEDMKKMLEEDKDYIFFQDLPATCEELEAELQKQSWGKDLKKILSIL